MEKLKFSLNGNAKLGKNIASISLLSGWSCPGAKECYTKVIETDGKLKVQDGKDQIYRCFSASQEALYKNVYNSRKYNYDLILNIVKKSINYNDKVNEIFTLLKLSLPNLNKWSILRLHVGGDIFCQEYFDALIKLANAYPDKIFYAYTKSIHFWIKRLNDIPSNFKLTASYGGKYDDLIDKYNLKSVKVIMSEEEAEMYNLEIDHDDSHAYNGNNNFALLLHGSQRKGSNAAKAKQQLSKSGWNGYSTNKSKVPTIENMLNLIQYRDLRFYLIELSLNINNIKNIRSVYDRYNSYFIDYSQNEIIYNNVRILDKITFEYEDIVYECFKVSQMSGNSNTKWICNCDANIRIENIYSNKTEKQHIVEDQDIYTLDENDLEFINKYAISFVNDTLYLYKLFNLGLYYAAYNKDTNLTRIEHQPNKSVIFLDACKKLNIVPKFIIQNIFNMHSDSTIIRITQYSTYHDIIVSKEPLYKLTEEVVHNDTNYFYVADVRWNNTTKQWTYRMENTDIWIEEPYLKSAQSKIVIGYRENKQEKIRPDLISPYFIEAIGRIMKENNEKYPEYNYTALPDSSFFQSLWRHIVAYSEQRLNGLSKEFDNEDHLAAIAFNVMGLVHNREVNKLN